MICEAKINHVAFQCAKILRLRKNRITIAVLSRVYHARCIRAPLIDAQHHSLRRYACGVAEIRLGGFGIRNPHRPVITG
jgi:hypothetical protein